MDVNLSQFVEHLGVICEADGLPRGAGRLFGLLLITPDEASLDDLAEQLELSKAAISVNARLLEHRGMIELITRPGDRRDYYRVSQDLLHRTMQQRLVKMQRFRAAIAGAQSLGIRNAGVLDRLDELDLAYQHLSNLLTEALADWAEHKPTIKKRLRGAKA